MHPLDLVGAAPWRKVVFTTYALSLSFFEAVVLDRLIRADARNTLILADPDGIRAGLSERGARRVGREYELEPIACSTGVFHPKLSMFFRDEDAHLLVGSGNLTFGGWGVNLEAVEHAHPSFAADVFDDAADMFELLAVDHRVRSGALPQFAQIASDLRQAAATGQRAGDLRLVHSVDSSILDQVANFVSELGGAERITVVSPYFDVNGTAVEHLASRLACEDINLHVHPSTVVRGLPGTNWPAGTSATAVCIDEPFGEDPRPLHAKCLEIMCRRGRVLVSGSANATRAALETGNIEASLVRIQRETLVGWTSRPAKPPQQIIEVEDSDADDDESRVGILRATLDGETIHGLLIEPRLTGPARLLAVKAAASEDLGDISIDATGAFSAHAPALEFQSWSGGRIVIRVEQGPAAAEGFVSVSAAAEIIRRAGALAPRILAMLSGTETPADAAALMTWMYENPLQLALAGHGEATEKAEREPVWVSLETLQTTHALASPSLPGSTASDPNARAWERAISMLRSAFMQPRGQWKAGTEHDDGIGDAGSDDSDTGDDDRQKDEEAKTKALTVFDSLLEVMLDPKNGGRHASMALAIAHYLVDRNRPAPSRVRNWLSRIVNAFPALDPQLDERAIGAAMLVKASDGLDDAASRARRFLLEHDLNPEQVVVDEKAIQPFIDTLAPGWLSRDFLRDVADVRTPGEQVSEYCAAADTGSVPDVPRLRASPHWPKLSKGLRDADVRSKFWIRPSRPTACPECNIRLPRAAVEELASFGVTRCCHIIMSTEV